MAKVQEWISFQLLNFPEGNYLWWELCSRFHMILALKRHMLSSMTIIILHGTHQNCPIISAGWLQKAFTVSIRCGMLPWRRYNYDDDLCIVEPYHPDRVAWQFRLDQHVPYTPLCSLYTIDDTSITYAYWWPFLRSTQSNPTIFPTELGWETLRWHGQTGGTLSSNH